MTVDSVHAGGARVPFLRPGDLLEVTLDRRYGMGEGVTVDVWYGGRPVPTGFGSFVFTERGGVPWIWSLSQPSGARDWWPCKDHPLDKADSVDVLVTCDSSLTVGSNGRLAEVTQNGNGTRTWHWAGRYPIAPYLVSIAVTNYIRISDWFRWSTSDSMEVVHLVTPGGLPAAAPLALTVDMLESFSRKFGLYPFVREKYGHAEIGSGGAMEHQTLSSATAAAFAEYVVAHELAHQWFGDMITCGSWRDIWLHEGFATYAEALWFEERYGRAAYRADMAPKLANARTARGTLLVEDTSSVGTLFDDALVYDKGACVLHMLRRVMGDSLFFLSLRNFAEDPRFRYGNASTEDFRRVCEAAWGDSLEWFFSQWMEREGHPHYLYSWSARETPPGWELAVRVDQAAEDGTPSLFAMPLEVAVGGDGWDTTFTRFNDASPQAFLFLLPAEPRRVELDPDEWILRTAALLEEGELTGPPGAYRLFQNHPNPFNGRTTCTYRLNRKSRIRLSILDILGRTVEVLVGDERWPGTWRVVWDPGDRAAGVYFCRLEAEGFVSTVKLLYLK